MTERAASLNDLGANLTEQGRFAEAEPLLQKSLLIRETLLGDDNLNTGYSLTNLALNALGRGNVGEAVGYARRVAHFRELTLGAGHPETALALQLLAKAELRAGNNQQALDAARAALGSRVPLTLREATAISDDARTVLRLQTAPAAELVTESAWELTKGGARRWTGRAPPMVDEAFMAAQRIPASGTADAFGRATARALAARNGVGDLARDYELAEDRRVAADRSIAEAIAEDLPDGPAKAERAEADQHVEALRRSLSPDRLVALVDAQWADLCALPSQS